MPAGERGTSSDVEFGGFIRATPHQAKFPNILTQTGTRIFVLEPNPDIKLNIQQQLGTGLCFCPRL